jgi:hypothetical protein
VKFAAIERVPTTSSDVPETLLGHLNEDGTVSGGIPIPGLTSWLSDPSTGRATVVQVWTLAVVVLAGAIVVPGFALLSCFITRVFSRRKVWTISRLSSAQPGEEGRPTAQLDSDKSSVSAQRSVYMAERPSGLIRARSVIGSAGSSSWVRAQLGKIETALAASR